LDVRVHVPGQHCAAGLLDEQIFRRRVHYVRAARHRHVHRTPRQPCGPDGLHISSGDQVHFPQVWTFRVRAKARFAVRVATKHRKREDLHIYMVLVSTAVGGAGPNDLSQVPIQL